MEAVAAPLWSSRRIREGVAYLGLAGLVASSALVFMGAEGRLGVLVPAARLRYPDWLRGPLSGLQIDLTPNGLARLLVGMCAGYVLVLVCADAVSMRVAVGTIVGLHVLFILGPPLVSTDVFGYIDLARLGTRHGISPYSPASTHIPPDSVHLYRRWHSDLPAPYGPVFMLIAYALVPLGVAGGLWGFKILAAAGSLATIWLVWRCAAALGRDPLKAALFVGLNPALLLFGVGGLTHGIRLVAEVALAAIVILMLRRVWRGGDWITAAGWTMFALLVASAWLLPWYVAWLLPLAAISADSRLRAAALALTAYIVITRVTLWAGLPP